MPEVFPVPGDTTPHDHSLQGRAVRELIAFFDFTKQERVLDKQALVLYRTWHTKPALRPGCAVPSVSSAEYSPYHSAAERLRLPLRDVAAQTDAASGTTTTAAGPADLPGLASTTTYEFVI